MQRTVRVLSIACSLVVLFASSSAAQESQSVRGTVTSIAAGAITIKAASGDMTFAVDPKTNVVVTGGGTATRTAEAAGKSGPQLSSLLKAGDMVEVAYQGAPGSMRATSIRRVTTLSGGGGGGGGAATETSEGTVESVTATALSISGKTSGGAFKQSFAIDGSTRVVGEGAGTLDKAKGGKMAITDYVAKGDRVTVTFDKKGDTLHAVEVRVRNRAK